MQIVNLVEGILLASDETLSLKDLEKILLGKADTYDIEQAIEELKTKSQNSSWDLLENNRGFRIVIKQEIAPFIQLMYSGRSQRYSRAMLETLAIIAYKQPVTRGEIEEIRGVGVSTQIIRNLEERDWVYIKGHKDTPGRPSLYATTKGFLDYFNLDSLKNLPPLSELPSVEDELWEDDLDRKSSEISKVIEETKIDIEEEEIQLELPNIKPLTFADLDEKFKSKLSDTHKETNLDEGQDEERNQ